ncbi:MAG: pur operon repressor [Acidibacillus sp.]|nr:pur operon repressor [Acidibacillus sp.]
MRRSERIVRLTRTLMNHPGEPLSLTDMADQLDAAKSSLSEDLAIIRDVMDEDGEGTLRTQMGASGGVLFEVDVAWTKAQEFLERAIVRLRQGDRILPGGYLYMSDVLAEPDVLRMVGKMFAKIFAPVAPDIVLTVETKGIPLTVMTAQYLHRPFVIARRDHRVTEGSSVSVNYVSGSDRRIQTMSLSKRSIKQGARVLIIDDFMKAGGTVKAMTALLNEFDADVVGTGVFMETTEPEGKKLVSNYVSLLTLAEVDEARQCITIAPGNYLRETT